VKLKTADEFYYGIRLINERRFDEAGKSLNQALKIQPRERTSISQPPYSAR
jgi:hypothetical protein